MGKNLLLSETLKKHYKNTLMNKKIFFSNFRLKLDNGKNSCDFWAGEKIFLNKRKFINEVSLSDWHAYFKSTFFPIYRL